MSADSDGPVEWCKPVPQAEAHALAERYPELTLRTEPAHREAFVALPGWSGSEAAAVHWQLACESLEAWVQEQEREHEGERLALTPEDLGLRITYLATGPDRGDRPRRLLRPRRPVRRRAMIEAHGLVKRYGSTMAVNDLSFSIRPGLVTGFLGPNGAGKTTTMRMILGLDAPTQGSVTVGGRSYRDLPAPMREVGALLDAKALHGGRRARDHLLCLAQSNGIPRRRVDEVLRTVGLEGVARRRAKGFSLGMSQRLGIASALLGDPAVLIFDEPVNVESAACSAQRGKPLSIPLGHLEVVLPIGISFYTFQSMSYVIDVYRREIKPTRNLVQFAVFVSFFPHLVAGPIMRPTTLLPQVASRRRFSLQQFYAGGVSDLLGPVRESCRGRQPGDRRQ